MSKYMWWWCLFFLGQGLVFANEYIITKHYVKGDKVNPMSHYEFWHLVFLAKINPTIFCGRDYLVSAVQRQGIRKKYGYTPTTTVSARREIEHKRQDRKRKLDMEMSSVMRKLHRRRTWERRHIGLMMMFCNQEAPWLGN